MLEFSSTVLHAPSLYHHTVTTNTVINMCVKILYYRKTVDYFVSFACGVEEIVQSDDVRMIQQSHHLQFTVLHNDTFNNEESMSQFTRSVLGRLYTVAKKTRPLRWTTHITVYSTHSLHIIKNPLLANWS